MSLESDARRAELMGELFAGEAAPMEEPDEVTVKTGRTQRIETLRAHIYHIEACALASEFVATLTERLPTLEADVKAGKVSRGSGVADLAAFKAAIKALTDFSPAVTKCFPREPRLSKLKADLAELLK
jgi:hypothetical protein